MKQIIPTLYSIILVLAIILSLYSVYSFTTGYSNSDFGINLNVINKAFGLNLVDTNSNGEVWTPQEMYMQGQKYMRISFILFGISLFLIGFSLSKIMGRYV